MADINHSVLNRLSLKTVESYESTPALQVGNSGIVINGIRKSTASVALGATAHDSVTTAVTVSGVAVGDPIIAIVPASQWSGAYYDVDLKAKVTAADTITLAAANSAATTVNTAAMNFDFFWLDVE